MILAQGREITPPPFGADPKRGAGEEEQHTALQGTGRTEAPQEARRAFFTDPIGGNVHRETKPAEKGRITCSRNRRPGAGSAGQDRRPDSPETPRNRRRGVYLYKTASFIHFGDVKTGDFDPETPFFGLYIFSDSPETLKYQQKNSTIPIIVVLGIVYLYTQHIVIYYTHIKRPKGRLDGTPWKSPGA